ncbi:TraB/GumN family protein [Parasphaerochaeta coccoides]|nr:TraB/GumN family protein [Parasphaerochaeta coccoides]
MTSERISDTIHKITLSDGRIITLVGTAHISQESVTEVSSIIDQVNPDHICIELDKGRFRTKDQESSWETMDLKKVLKEGKGFLLLANMVLASFQKRMSVQTGSAPGQEILGAAYIAQEKGIPFSFCDREIQVTLKRAWRKSSLWNKAKLLSTLLSSAFDKGELEAVDLEKLKEQDVLQGMLDELSKELPTIKEVLIDERDRYLASSIYSAPGKNIVAVIGAGHAQGLIENMGRLDNGEMAPSLDDISDVPPAGKAGKVAVWLIPLALVGLIVAGFINAGWNQGLTSFLYWALINGSFAGIGAIAALAHPLTILVTIVTAPVAALHPAIGVGMIAGIMELTMRHPRVKDFEQLNDDITSVRGWYRNRIFRALLVFLLSSVGSILGTFIAFPWLISKLV